MKSKFQPSSNYEHPLSKSPFKSPSILDGYEVTIVETVGACEQFLATRVPDPVKLVGLDCEWRSSGWLNKYKYDCLSTTDDQELKDDGEKLDQRTHSSEKDLLSVSSDCPVALLQLAFPNGELVLVRLCKMRRVGERLRDILSDRR